MTQQEFSVLIYFPSKYSRGRAVVVVVNYSDFLFGFFTFVVLLVTKSTFLLYVTQYTHHLQAQVFELLIERGTLGTFLDKISHFFP